MKLDEKQLNEIFESVKPSLIEGLKEELKSGIQWEAKQEIAKQIQKAVTDWASVNILPDVVSMLVESKEGIMKCAFQASESIVAEMSKSMAKTVKKNLEQSYTRSKIFKALLD